MDHPKGQRGRGHVRYRLGRRHFKSRSFKSNIKISTSTVNHKKDMIFSSWPQVKQVTSYVTARDSCVHNIHNSYGQGVQDVTKSLNYMMSVDLSSEETKINISRNTYDKRKAIEQTGYDNKYQE